MEATLQDRRILLGVTGSIAAYKAADLASRLRHLGADLQVVLTRNAERLVGAPTFRALTGNPVLVGVFDEPYEKQIAHIHAAQTPDLVVVAPATANIVAKMATGIADDMLSTILLASTAPVLLAPAMNSAMLAHPATQANLTTLAARGVGIVQPGFGVLACRTEGCGKLANVDDIVDAIIGRLARVRDLQGARVLVTAGATREPIDPVRFLSNRSSGRMGVALAEAGLERGASVTVVAAHVSVPLPAQATVERVETTEQMLSAVLACLPESDVLIAAAAPADFAPARVEEHKIKKRGGASLTLNLCPTPDILKAVAGVRGRQVVVGFAAETRDVEHNAQLKLAAKRLDLIVANDVTAPGAGFDVATNVVTLLHANGHRDDLPRMSKREVADRILDAVVPLLAERRGPDAG
ncbi:MAG TPA: bifunctional phosphopantothenoylcysteine decarboxylase/phosphopantothenate--cysteine ligase CoaBC [Chthonomonadales bacterium]|nr:bifunctional phosphopantothenoylcysteine decarboxylase/phosphopantothenate--cysteine ligase CoaBC [Chthonomonadales bacterium]